MKFFLLYKPSFIYRRKIQGFITVYSFLLINLAPFPGTHGNIFCKLLIFSTYLQSHLSYQYFTNPFRI